MTTERRAGGVSEARERGRRWAQMGTTVFLVAWLVATSTARGGDAVDYARARYRAAWLSHPVVGEPSWDTLQRRPGNPIYTGVAPYEWPVNGFLFSGAGSRDRTWYAQVSLYPRGYWPAGPSRLLRSRDAGGRWEDLGLALVGDKDAFDGDGRRAGATLDVTAVQDGDGCHLVYGWAKPDNSDGGIAYAWGPTAEGPFRRDPQPIHAESRQPLVEGGYKRVYASTLVKRERDWLILADMSTPGNAGGKWAFVGLTGPTARGPYTGPVFLRAPHGEEWFPQPIEFATAFVHEGWVYAPFTSVAANRGWQVLLRARVEAAHRPEAWEVFQAGSLWHWEGAPSEAAGIWGQTFTGFVDRRGNWNLMYPARNAENTGTMHLMSRPWRRPFRDGFWVSAPNASSVALLGRRYRDFKLETEITSTGDIALVWDVDAPLAQDRVHADGGLADRAWRGSARLALRRTGWEMESRDMAGGVRRWARGEWTALPRRVRVERKGAEVRVEADGRELHRGPGPVGSGSPGWLAERGSALEVRRFRLVEPGEAGVWWASAEDGLLGAGWTADRWRRVEEGYRSGVGYAAGFEGARAKWNVTARRIRLWAPRSPEGGEAELRLDGEIRAVVGFHATAMERSAALWDSGELSPGPHVVSVRRKQGELHVDCLEIHAP